MANVVEARDMSILKGMVGTVNFETVELLGFYHPNDGGGGTFFWYDFPSSPPTDNGIHIMPGGGYTGDGRWVRIFDNHINIKWFGCYNPAGINMDVTTEFQEALNFARSENNHGLGYPKSFNVFIPRGQYMVSSTLNFNLTGLPLSTGRVKIYGEGTNESIISFTGSAADTVLYVKGDENGIIEFSDFLVKGPDPTPGSTGTGTGIQLVETTSPSMNNVQFIYLKRGLYMDQVNGGLFENLIFQTNELGVEAEKDSLGTFTNPNTFSFINCKFLGNKDLGVQLTNFHNVTFDTCAFEHNGSDNTKQGAINGISKGEDGAHGITVSNCYFEKNAGTADIRIYNDYPYYGFLTHCFTGNTFNRISGTHFTTYNILLEGNGQTPTPLLGQSKCKLVIQGNGFFGKYPNGAQYIATPTRPTIFLDFTDFFEFDVVEQSNQYVYYPQNYPTAGAQYNVDAPVFSTTTPQISEHTRVKAFGDVTIDALGNPVLGSSYNVSNVFINTSTLGVEVVFANALSNLPLVMTTSNQDQGNYPLVVMTLMDKSLNGFIVDQVDLGGNVLNVPFSFVVY